jgi:Mg-chelatase subunit ChlD
MTERLLSIVVVLLCMSTGRAQQAPAFSSKIEAVRVDVLVTGNGEVVRGLGPADFEIFDNGVRPTPELVSFDQVPLNVILSVDASDSVAGERLEQLRAAGNRLLASLTEDDQAALVAFSHIVQLGAKLTPDAALVREALGSVQGSGATALVDGTYAAIMIGESDAGRALVIVFSDGVDTSSWLRADLRCSTLPNAPTSWSTACRWFRG